MNKNLLILLIIIISASVMYFISGYPKTETVICTQEALICPDGTAVGRSGPKCAFAPCPIIKQITTPSSTPQCPKTEWVDCMPGSNKIKSECDPQYLKWAKENCPNFKGETY